MGTNVAPLYANLYLAHQELLWKRQGILPTFYMRYLDDIITVIDEKEFNGTDPSRAQNTVLRALDSSIMARFTYETCGHTGTFLDIEVSAPYITSRNGTLKMRPYVKPMNKGLYTSPSTYQPRSQKYSWIGGEMIRLLRLSSTEESWLAGLSVLTMNLQKRGYSEQTILHYTRYCYDDRARYLVDGIKRPLETRLYASTSNIPGRHLLHNIMTRMIRTCTSTNERREAIPAITIVVLKGCNLFDHTRRINDSLSLCRD